MQDFDNHRKLVFWGTYLLNHTGEQKLRIQPHLLFGSGAAAGGDEGVTEKQNQGGKVAEDGTRSLPKLCLPKVYPVVYTPRRAAAPRAEGATLWSKKNM